MSTGARPVSLLLRVRPELQPALLPRGGATALAFVDAGGGARVALVQSDVQVAAPRGDAVQAPQLPELLRRVHDPAVRGGRPAARGAPEDPDRHLLRGRAGLRICGQQTLCVCDRGAQVLDAADYLLLAVGCVHARCDTGCSTGCTVFRSCTVAWL